MERRQLPKEGIIIYVYVTRHRHVENLLILKRLHLDLCLPDELKEPGDEIERLSPREFDGFVKAVKSKGFVKAVKRLEKEWEYEGNGIWTKRINLFTLYMTLIMKGSRWTVRPAISKENMKGYGFEIPVDTGLSDAFMRDLRGGELEEIHDHVENKHFHLTVESLQRCMDLAEKWDYYFSTTTKWRQTIFLSENQDIAHEKAIKPRKVQK